MVEINLEYFRKIGMDTTGTEPGALLEEYRQIKLPLLKHAFREPADGQTNENLVLVTSSLPGEGKTFTAINLAISISMERDKTVLLVDADVVRPSVTAYLGIDAQAGLVDYLSDETSNLSDFLLRTSVPNFGVLPAGRRDPHAAELLASARMAELMRELALRYRDRVAVFDGPPLLASNQARILAALAGQVVVVVEAEKTARGALQEALSRLDREKSIALVLNKRRPSKRDYSSYYGYYGYQK